MRVKNASLNVGIAFLSLGMALGTGEALFRLFPPRTLEPGHADLLTEYDSVLGWRKTPFATGRFVTAEYAVAETINAKGLRGPEYAYHKAPGEYRILILGDSYAEGYTVSSDEVCAAVLERLLPRRPGRRYHVINAGTGGYSTDQELLYFETEGKRYHPDLTVVLFYVNDVWYNGQPKYWRGWKPQFVLDRGKLVLRNVPVPRPDPHAFRFEIQGGTGVGALVRRADAWLGARSRLYGFLRDAVKHTPVLSGLAVRLGWAEIPNEFRAWKTTPDPDLGRAWDITEAVLAQLEADVTAIGSRLLILYVPSRPSVYPDDWQLTKRAYAITDGEWRPEQDGVELATMCQRQHIDCIDPTARFRDEALRLAGQHTRLYFAEDAHWTAEGHRLTGQILAEHIEGTYLTERRANIGR